MRILFYTDLHAKDQNPRSRTGSYRDDIIKKLHEIIHLAQKYEVDYLVNGADTFDQKSSWRTSHLIVQDMIEIMRPFPGERHITIIGTHDVPTGQLEKLHQQPLGVLESARVISVIGLPPNNILRFSDVVFHGVHASYDLDKDPSNYEWHHSENRNDVPYVTIAHGMIVPPRSSVQFDHTNADLINTEADLVLYGHPHTPDGIFKNKYGTIFIGPGSVARLGSYPYNRTRTPNVVLAEWAPHLENKWKFKEIPLESARPAHEVFAEVLRDEEDENEVQERVNAFVHMLNSADINDDTWQIEDLRLELRAMDVPEEVKHYAELILDEVA